MSNRRHLYIPDDVWSRLTSEAGTAGVRERGRAYSASEYACKLLRTGMGLGDLPSVDDVIGVFNEQSTRADAQQPERSGGAKQQAPVDGSLVREGARKVQRKRAARQKGAASGRATNTARVAAEGWRCLRQGCTQIAQSNGYCSASHRLADEQEGKR